MKASVLYYSKSGNTKKMAEVITEGMNTVEGMEAKAISIDAVDAQWIEESSCVILGSPAYYTGNCAAVSTFMEGFGQYKLAGKIGGAFATAGFTYGGGEIGMQDILSRMLFWGMLSYSGGNAYGKPPIHLGPLAIAGKLDESVELFREYGRRMATGTVTILGK